MKPWQTDRNSTKQFFVKKDKGGLSLASSPWVTLAVGKELQQFVIDGTIQSGMRALDIGCSIGIEAMYLAKQGLDVIGVDYIAESIEVARKVAALVEAPVEFVADDFLTMDLQTLEGTRDVVIDQGCFHHSPVAERSEYAKRAAQVLKSGGYFFLRGFSDQMLPSPTGDGPIRLTADDLLTTFGPHFAVEKMFRFQNIPLPDNQKPQIFWAFLGKKR